MDANIEALIDRAGRDRVFAAMRSVGWGAGGAPKWVWQAAACEVIRRGTQKNPAEPEPSGDCVKGGNFRMADATPDS